MKLLSKIIFYLILVVFPLGQLLRINLPFLGPDATLQPIDGLVFFFSLFWLGHIFLKKKDVNPPLFFKEFLIFGAIAGFSLLLKLDFPAIKTVNVFLSNLTKNEIRVLSFGEFIPPLLYLARFWNYIVFYFCITDFFREERKSSSKYFIFGGLAIAFIAIGQYAFFPDTRILKYIGWDDHYFRAIGSFLDPGFTGVILVLSLIALIIDFLDEEKSLHPKIIFASFILLLATGLSFSRASYIVLVIGMMLTFFFHKRLKAYMILSVVFAAIIFLIPKPGGEGVDLLRKSSIFAKSDNYKQIWEIIENNTWLGVGFNAYRYAQRDYGFISNRDWQSTHAGAGADNSFLFVWATAGFLGFLSFVYLWWRIVIESYYSIKRSKTSLLVFVVSIVLVISSTVINSLFYPWILFWLVLLLSEFTVENELPTQVQSCSEPDQSTQS
ncbi:O-antigen ligase domain-containing protein [Candidatus Microgenomates bacterium]|jgi:hypothetical protein|nr:MAG: O-antigen ligase domain-containing protein [Candidatus Microgenomates bacterium]